MIRLLRTLLLGLLKLVLQLIILAVTGRWVHIGRPNEQPKPAPERGRRRRERAKPTLANQGAGGRRPVFERRKREAAAQGRAARGEPATLEERWALREAEVPSLEALVEEGASSWEQRRGRPTKRRALEAPPSPPRVRPSLADALRDPRAIRRAILVGSAVAPRRR